MKEAFAAALDAPVERAVQLAGGASKEAWAVETGSDLGSAHALAVSGVARVAFAR